jgi:hypothetical protein
VTVAATVVAVAVAIVAAVAVAVSATVAVAVVAAVALAVLLGATSGTAACTLLRSNSSNSMSPKPSPPSSASSFTSLPLSCIYKNEGSVERSVVTFVAAFVEAEEAAVEVVEIVTRHELRVVSRLYS